MAKGKLVLVGADKGGVGKTMVSRLLIDWIAARVSPFSVFDTESSLDGKTTLRRFRSSSKVANVASVAGKMEIFDGLANGGLTLVDMRAGTLSETLRDLRNAGFLEKADDGHIALCVVHVLGASTQSMGEIADVNALLGGDSAHVLVENHANDGQFFKWDDAMRSSLFRSISPAAHFDIPHLDSQAAEDVDRRALGFAAYTSAQDGSDYLRRVVRFWMKQCFQKFDEASMSKVVGIA